MIALYGTKIIKMLSRRLRHCYDNMREKCKEKDGTGLNALGIKWVVSFAQEGVY